MSQRGTGFEDWLDRGENTGWYSNIYVPFFKMRSSPISISRVHWARDKKSHFLPPAVATTTGGRSSARLGVFLFNISFFPSTKDDY